MKKTTTPLSELGEFGLIERIAAQFQPQRSETVLGIGDDAAIVEAAGNELLISTDMLVEGIHFDLTYTPLQHLGYKAAVVNFSDIAAMGGEVHQLLVSMALSNRFGLEAVDALYEGMAKACDRYGVDLIGGDTTSSKTGLVLCPTVMGRSASGGAIRRSGARPRQLIVVTGDLGGAYIGLQVLEREKIAYTGNEGAQPDLSPYAYAVGRLLKPEARFDVIEWLREQGIVPTAMIDLSDGLSSDLIHLCRSSRVGCRIYEERLPIAEEVYAGCEEFRLNATTVALNGGEDYELLFTVDVAHYDVLKQSALVTLIGETTEWEEGMHLIANTQEVIPLKAQGWNPLLDAESVNTEDE
ncbi:thiamine-phosphate kinase [bacterium]|nr:thiamine-phosphate kinase [bacterium]